MDVEKIAFRKAAKADKQKVNAWLKAPHIKEYWDKSSKAWDHFQSYISGETSPLEFWICSMGKEPYGLIATSQAFEDYFASWVEPEGETLVIDFVIGEESYLGKGLSSETLKRFAQAQATSVKAFLADPEVRNEKALHVFEKAGFVKVSTHIKGQGFFKGQPHYLLKLKLP